MNEHAVSDEIDLFWHTHILYTRQYIDFCDRVFGEYIHHDPLDHENTSAVSEIVELYEYTMAVYDDILLGPLDEQFFPRDVPDYMLVCKHMFVTNSAVMENSVYSQR